MKEPKQIDGSRSRRLPPKLTLMIWIGFWVVLWLAAAKLDVSNIDPVIELIRAPYAAAIRVYYHGSSRHCPLCETDLRRFRPAGLVSRSEAECPICGSRERHRLAWLYFQQRTNLFDGTPKRMLHVAPEYQISKRIQEADYIDYLSADLSSPLAMVKMDVTDIQYPDDSFDVIYCSHVLEHVPDDRRAMAELYRVLKPGGWAVLDVPVLQEKTFEDPSVTTPEDRERIFGQSDHVRIYGIDYVDRLEQAGFHVTVDPFIHSFSQEEVLRYGLPPESFFPYDRYIYLCRK